jgi:hypothetical protein
MITVKDAFIQYSTGEILLIKKIDILSLSPLFLTLYIYGSINEVIRYNANLSHKRV